MAPSIRKLSDCPAGILVELHTPTAIAFRLDRAPRFRMLYRIHLAEQQEDGLPRHWL